jgi:hypothetical protein
MLPWLGTLISLFRKVIFLLSILAISDLTSNVEIVVNISCRTKRYFAVGRLCYAFKLIVMSALRLVQFLIFLH